MMKYLACLGVSALALAEPVSAGIVDEARLGVMAHNLCITDCKNADKEDGPNIQGEIVFNSPDFLSWAFSPKPFVMASVNTAGNTSFAGAGLQYSFRFADNWAFEPGLAYVIHDGAVSNPFPDGSPQASAFTDENVLLGSEDLFRTTFALTRYFNDRLGAQLIYEHLSHGQILGDGRNQGLDNFGVRLTYTFGD